MKKQGQHAKTETRSPQRAVPKPPVKPPATASNVKKKIVKSLKRLHPMD